MTIVFEVVAALVGFALLLTGFIIVPFSAVFIVGGCLMFAALGIYSELVTIREALERAEQRDILD